MNDKISWFGIDFGTTNSAAFSFTGATKETMKPISYGDDEGRPLPSIVAINKNTGEVITGRKAKDAKNELMEDCEFFSSVKTVLDKDKIWNIAGKDWMPEDIAAEVFKSIKEKIERDSDNVIDEAVISVPVGFSINKKGHLRRAALKAGISVKMFINEPTAAFCSNYLNLKSCRNVAVFDWGGGTLDVAVLKVDDGIVQELATESLSVAGDDIDKKIAQKIHDKFMKDKEQKIAYDELDAVTKDQLLLKCEKAKCDFSDDEDLVQISINKYGNYGSVRDTISYDFFSLLLESEINDAIGCLEQAIKKADLNKVTLDRILCVGGSSKLKPLREKLSLKYGEDMIYYPDKVMWDIAKGAAIISTNPGRCALCKSIGMLLSDGSYLPFFQKGQEIPCKEFELTLGTVDKTERNTQYARFVFTDSHSENDRTFLENFVVPIRGFVDEYIKLSCYIDPDFIFKLKVCSSNMPEEASRVWSYDKLKIFYQIERGK